tara:strand:+ start:1668 stop:2381 length:714 start_codon:yes stop_codon:yes gene_type:complete
MIKNFLLKILSKLILFFNNKLKVKLQPASPADLYFQEVSKNCYDIFKDHFKESFVFADDNSIREFAINEAIKKFDKENLFLEFGVFKGDSINLFAKNLKKRNAEILGFDSFKGLRDEWMTEEFNPPGTFDLKGKKPKVENNVKLIDGWVEDTLKNFLSNNSKKIAFIHFDLDTYKSTSIVLKLIKNLLQPGTIILFDEFYGFPNWEKYEFKAFKEEIAENKFKYIAFGTRQACIKII